MRWRKGGGCVHPLIHAFIHRHLEQGMLRGRKPAASKSGRAEHIVAPETCKRAAHSPGSKALTPPGQRPRRDPPTRPPGLPSDDAKIAKGRGDPRAKASSQRLRFSGNRAPAHCSALEGALAKLQAAYRWADDPWVRAGSYPRRSTSVELRLESCGRLMFQAVISR